MSKSNSGNIQDFLSHLGMNLNRTLSLNVLGKFESQISALRCLTFLEYDPVTTWQSKIQS